MCCCGCVYMLVLQAFTFSFVFGEISQNSTLKDIYILGLFPMEGAWTGGLGIQPAAEIAIDYVNRDTNVLPGYRLNMLWNNTKCNPGLAVKILADRMCGSPRLIMIIGGGCSIVSQAVAQSTHMWNLVQISFMSMSAALSNKQKYPYFFRVINSEQQLNSPRVELLRYFNWTKVMTIHQSFQLFSTMIEHIESLMLKHNLTIVTKYVFSEDPKMPVRQLKENDARIIIGGFYEDKARQVFCEAYKLKFSGPKIVWLLPGFYKTQWWEGDDTDCSGDQILSVIGNYLTFDNVFFKTNDTELDGNDITLKEFMYDYNRKTNYKSLPGHLRASTGYDSIWAIARALNATMNDLKNTGYGLEDFSYTNDYMGELIKNNTSKVNFNSISSQVLFNKNGDARKLMKIQQLQDGKLVTVGWYNTLNVGRELSWSESTQLMWVSGVVPKDSLWIMTEPVSVSLPLYIIMCVLAALGMVLSAGFLGFNIKYRHIRVIKMSSPNINSVILMGCFVVYTFVFVHGLDARQLTAMCQVKGFLLLIGFSLVFGALFAKTWRVYVIYMASQKFQKRAPKDSDLFAKVGMLTAVNAILMVIWTVVDPRQPIDVRLESMKIEDPANDRVIIPVTWHCTSCYFTYFNVILFSIQGILLLLGVFLAFTTRKVTIPALNDSKYIGMCIYNVIGLSTVGLPVSILLQDNVDVTYGLVSVLIIAGTTATQCLIFVPKVLAFKNYMEGDKMKCRTEFAQSVNVVAPSHMACNNADISSIDL